MSPAPLELIDESILRKAKFLSRNVPEYIREDAAQEALLAAVECAPRFDAGRGIQFGTFADHRMRGAIRDYQRSMDWVPRQQRQRIKSGIEDEPAPLKRAVTDPALSPEGRAAAGELQDHLLAQVALLDTRQRYVIACLYWLDCTAKEVGRAFGVSFQRVWQIEAKARRQLVPHLRPLKGNYSS